MKPQMSNRQSLRVPGYDYASGGAYFVTVCTKDRKCIFGTVDGTSVKLTLPGRVAEESWRWLAERYSFVRLDEWILMPNHLHAIIWLENSCSKPLGSLIGAYKTVSSKRIKELLGPMERIWQRNYHEHIIRSEKSLCALRQYILDNPCQWQLDKENPASEEFHAP